MPPQPRNFSEIKHFEADILAREPVNFENNQRIFEALFLHARDLGAIRPGFREEDYEAKIRLARILNVS